mmetsp:Transcript_92177/g.260429  ORF Transcript_92177/g.260429 Transcript_92177/m.260429 type:complete len:208 (-) Transcript_92177:1434-2057(-)
MLQAPSMMRNARSPVLPSTTWRLMLPLKGRAWCSLCRQGPCWQRRAIRQTWQLQASAWRIRNPCTTCSMRYRSRHRQVSFWRRSITRMRQPSVLVQCVRSRGGVSWLRCTSRHRRARRWRRRAMHHMSQPPISALRFRSLGGRSWMRSNSRRRRYRRLRRSITWEMSQLFAPARWMGNYNRTCLWCGSRIRQVPCLRRGPTQQTRQT